MLSYKNKFINKEELYELFLKLRELNLSTNLSERDKEHQIDKVVNKIGEYMFVLVNKLACSRSFWGYSYKEDFMGSAFIQITKAIRNFKFDCDVSINPFCFYTSIAYWTFQQVIIKEKKLATRKFNYIKDQLSVTQQRMDYNNYITYDRETPNADEIKNEMDNIILEGETNDETNRKEYIDEFLRELEIC